MRSERAQATVEALCLVPLLVALALAAAQGVLAAWAAVEAADAARAGARAALIGADGPRTARAALARPLRAAATVGWRDGALRVGVRVPAVLPGLGVRVDGTAR
jgi:hypothetical protein